MLQNATVTTFTVSELFRKNQQVKLSPTQIRAKEDVAFPCIKNQYLSDQSTNFFDTYIFPFGFLKSCKNLLLPLWLSERNRISRRSTFVWCHDTLFRTASIFLLNKSTPLPFRLKLKLQNKMKNKMMSFINIFMPNEGCISILKLSLNNCINVCNLHATMEV